MLRKFPLPETMSAVSIALIGLLLTAALFTSVRAWEEDNTRKKFREQAGITAMAIERNLQGAHGDLRLLRELFDRRNGEVGREEFRLFTTSLLKRAPFVQGFALHRIILDQDRAAFEKQRAGEFPGYRIQQLRHGQSEVASQRPFYRVIDYIEPFQMHGIGMGHDAHIPGHPAAKAALAAEASGQPVVSPLLALPYIKEYGFLIFMPLYYQADMPPGWQRSRAYGYAVAIFVIGTSVRKTLSMSDAAPAMELKLFGKDVEDWVEAYATPASTRTRSAPLPLLGRLFDNADLHYTRDFNLLNAPWRLSMSLPRVPQWEAHIGSLLTLAVGVLLSAALALYVWSNASARRRIGALVSQRTLELNLANSRLRDDVARREAHHRILNLMAGGISLAFVVDEIMLFLQSQLEGRLRCLVLLDDASMHAPGLPQQLLATLAKHAQSELRVGANELRWWKGQPGQAPAFDKILADHALRPVASRAIHDRSGKPLGVLLILETGSESFAKVDDEVLHVSSDLLGIAIESRRAEEHVRHLALNDELTGLPNRLSFSQHLQRSIAKAERGGAVAVMFLDLDRFKYINDHFGHDAGDEVLRTVASGFRSCLREQDVLARIGGDEFMLLVEQFEGVHQLSEIAQRLLEEASRPFELGGQSCHLGVSVGIAVWPEDGTNPIALMKNADTAMYRAKALGRNAYQFFSPEMTSDSLNRMALETGLRRAIDGREIVVFYQPKLDVTSGKLVGLEALVRWQHEEKGLILPAGFVPFAEEIGLISTIGMQVLQITCEDVQRLKAAGVDCGRVAINLSVVQFNDEHLVDHIHEVITLAGVDPTLLEIELTESMVMQNPQRAIRMMHGLRALGITLSIDDFGTGYSSLASLKRLPVDRIKVDRSFIEDVTRDDQAAAILEAIVAMTHTLGLRVVAEGVETAAQLDLLKRVGCDEYQGYYYSEPLPLERLMEHLAVDRGVRNAARFTTA